MDVGILELNRNPENYFQDVEQAAFNPMNTVEGIGFSPDKMLQGLSLIHISTAAIAIYQLPGSNSLDVSKVVKAKMKELGSSLPEGLSLIHI